MRDSKLVGLLAFIALTILAVAYVIAQFGGNLGILTLIANILAFVVLALCAYHWTSLSRNRNIWNVVLLIVLIILVLFALAGHFQWF